MKATFNYTGRQRIHRSRIVVELSQMRNGSRTFDARMNLQGLDLPPDAAVSVEAYYKRSFMRFPYGTVALLRPPEDRRLIEIDAGDQVFFRVKITEEGEDGHGRILASADRITPGSPEDDDLNRKPLLPVNHRDDLGQVVWRLVFDEVNGPVLEVNSRIEGIKEIVRSDSVFFALVYPSVLKQIFTRILLVEEEAGSDEADHWTGEWMTWIRSFYRPDPPGLDDDFEVDAWIDEAVSAFCNHSRTREKYVSGLQEARS